jgi:hypothetical protein
MPFAELMAALEQMAKKEVMRHWARANCSA